MQVCFIGHRTIEKNEKLISSLRNTIISLINKGADIFLFGSKSDFDKLSWEIVTELKKEYPFIKRVYARSAYEDITNSYEKHLLKFYEATYFSPKLKNAGKYSYVKRNYEMIDNSTWCVFYYNKDYIPQIRIKSNSNMNLSPKRNSGTKIAYEYAVKKKKEIINLYGE